AEQGRSYFDRVTDARAIVPPQLVLKAIMARCRAVVEVGQHLGGAAGAVELDVHPIPSFTEDAARAVAELNELTATHDVVVLCQNDGEAQRLNELLREFTRPDFARPPADVVTQYLHRGLIWNLPSGRPLALVPYQELLHRYYTRRRARRLST